MAKKDHVEKAGWITVDALATFRDVVNNLEEANKVLVAGREADIAESERLSARIQQAHELEQSNLSIAQKIGDFLS